MSKRGFRQQVQPRPAARYPTLDVFDAGRRECLAHLGLALVAGLLASCTELASCADNSIGGTADASPARLDQRLEMGRGKELGRVGDLRSDTTPDVEHDLGTPDRPPIKADKQR